MSSKSFLKVRHFISCQTMTAFSRVKISTETAIMSFQSCATTWYLNYDLPNLMIKEAAFFMTENVDSGTSSDIKETGNKIVVDDHFTGKSLKLEILLLINSLTLGKSISVILIILVHRIRSLKLMIFNDPLKFLYLSVNQFLK